MRSEDFARKIGVSPVTVSRVLNNSPLVSEKTRRRVLKAMEEMDFYPSAVAQSLARRSVRTLGFLLVLPKSFRSQGEDVSIDPWMQRVLNGVIESTREYGYNTLVDMVEDPLELARVLKSGQIAGCLIRIARYDTSTCRVVREIVRDLEMPIAFLDFFPLVDGALYINGGNLRGAEMVVGHLIDAGHRRIAHIQGNPRSYTTKQRRVGYLRSLRKAGLPFTRELIETGDFTERGGSEAMKRLMAQRPRPTAVFCANDRSAIGAIQAALEMGLRVPEDVAVAGFEDIEVAQFVTPPLTTVRYPFFEMGKVAAGRVLAALSGSDAAQAGEIPSPSLVVRQSG